MKYNYTAAPANLVTVSKVLLGLLIVLLYLGIQMKHARALWDTNLLQCMSETIQLGLVQKHTPIHSLPGRIGLSLFSSTNHNLVPPRE